MTRTRHREIPPETPIRDLPPEEQAEAVRPFMNVLDSVLSFRVGDVASAMKGSDLPRILQKFRGGTQLAPDPRKLAALPTIDPEVEASLERKMARFRSEPNPAEVIPSDVYEQLTNPAYICPRVGRAVEQVMRLGFTDKPMKSGIRFIRKTHTIDGPMSDDLGCILLFHFPVDEEGKPLTGLTEDEKPGHPVCAVAVEFDAAGKLSGIKRYEVSEGDKFRSPFNAYISVVPPIPREDHDEYYYRRLALKPLTLDADHEAAMGKTVQQAYRERADHVKGNGRLVGVSRTTDGRDLRVYQVTEAGIPSRFAVLRSKEHVIEGVYSVKEDSCPQTEIEGVRVGIFVESKTRGIPLKKRMGDVMKETAVEERFWMGRLARISYADRKRMTHEALMSIASAVAPLQLEDEPERTEDILRFAETHAPVVPFLIGLREEIQHVPAAEKRNLPEELVTASYAQLFAAAVYMQRRGRVLNETYPLESLGNFREVMGELSADEQRQMFGRTDLIISPEATRIIQRIDVMEEQVKREMTVQHAKLEGRIREHVDEVVGKASEGLRDGMRADIEKINGAVGSLTEQQQRDTLQAFREGLGEIRQAWPEQAKLIEETMRRVGREARIDGKLRLTLPLIPFFLSAELEGKAPGIVSNTIRKIGRAFRGMLESMEDVDPHALALYQMYSQQGM